MANTDGELSLKAIQDEIGAVGQKIARAALGKEELKDRLNSLDFLNEFNHGEKEER